MEFNQSTALSYHQTENYLSMEEVPEAMIEVEVTTSPPDDVNKNQDIAIDNDTSDDSNLYNSDSCNISDISFIYPGEDDCHDSINFHDEDDNIICDQNDVLNNVIICDSNDLITCSSDSCSLSDISFIYPSEEDSRDVSTNYHDDDVMDDTIFCGLDDELNNVIIYDSEDSFNDDNNYDSDDSDLSGLQDIAELDNVDLLAILPRRLNDDIIDDDRGYKTGSDHDDTDDQENVNVWYRSDSETESELDSGYEQDY